MKDNWWQSEWLDIGLVHSRLYQELSPFVDVVEISDLFPVDNETVKRRLGKRLVPEALSTGLKKS